MTIWGHGYLWCKSCNGLIGTDGTCNSCGRLGVAAGGQAVRPTWTLGGGLCMKCGQHNAVMDTATGTSCSFCGHVTTDPAKNLEAITPKELQKDIVAEPITAYRMWSVFIGDHVMIDPNVAAKLAEDFDAGKNPFRNLFSPRFKGVGNAVQWNTTVHDAKCSNAYVTHDAPAKDCQCGVWGLKTEEELKAQLFAYASSHQWKVAFGTVQLWGRIFEHEKGYRAQYAKPLSVTVLGVTEEEADQISEFYGCEVQVEDAEEFKEQMSEVSQRLSQYGTLITSSVTGGFGVSGTNPYTTGIWGNVSSPNGLISFPSVAGTPGLSNVSQNSFSATAGNYWLSVGDDGIQMSHKPKIARRRWYHWKTDVGVAALMLASVAAAAVTCGLITYTILEML